MFIIVSFNYLFIYVTTLLIAKVNVAAMHAAIVTTNLKN